MKIISAKYVKSFVKIKDFDLPHMSAIAFIGRSNIGKSSLINHLLNRKSLLKTSATPGKTQLFHFFVINKSFYFVDLPGYGFAKAPNKIRQHWEFRIKEFLYQCPELKLVFQLVDLRHDPSSEDSQFQQFIGECPVQNRVIANKSDKLKKNQRLSRLINIQKKLKLQHKPFIHSKPDKIGKNEIWDQIIPFI